MCIVAHGLAVWSDRCAREKWTIKGKPVLGAPVWQSLRLLKGHIKVGHVDAQQDSLPGSGDWSHQGGLCPLPFGGHMIP